MDCSKRVCDFLLPDGQRWNEQRLRQFFFDGDVDDILRTTIGRPGSTDFQAWNFTNNGIFAVKLAYHLAV